MLLQRTRILPNQRLDLNDYNNIENFACADLKAINKNVLSDSNYVLSGFECSGLGTTDLAVAVAGSAAVFGKDDGNLYIGAPSLAALSTSAFTPSSSNFVELIVEQDTGGADTRAFWDPTANGGQGGEFSQIVDTYIFTKVSFAINDSNFTGDSDKLPICEVVVDSSGIITAIYDKRDLFYRLGRANNPLFNFSWASRTEPSVSQFTGADKDITTEKQWKDAVMTMLKELAGTEYWYEVPGVSVIGSFNNSALSVLAGLSNNARFKWDGSQLSITDDSGSPTDSDQIAALRILTETFNLTLSRQSGSGAITLADGDVLWIQIPDPVANVNYDGVGATSTNYRVSPRGALPLNKNTYWLAYREGTKVYLRALGELEPGEEREINDETGEALEKYLGFNSETATSVPYLFYPNSLLFGNTFNNQDTLVKAISTNTANINAIGTVLDENVYEEHLRVVAGAPANTNQVTGPVTSGTLLTLPNDSRDSNAAEQYLVGDGILEIFLNGKLLLRDEDYSEVGTSGTLSTDVQILFDLVVDDKLTFRIGSLGGFNVGASGGGGDVVEAQNIGIGEGQVYKQKVTGVLELRTLKAGAGISIVTSGDQIIISATGGAASPAFLNYVTGQTTQTISTGGFYNLGTDKLEVWRNGVHMTNTLSAGDPVDRYQEATSNSILTDVAFPATATDVFTFKNWDVDSISSTLVTGQTGTVLTLPSYTVGNGGLRVYRNGILMNKSGLGLAVDRYTESSSTTITLASSASASDVFLVVNRPAPTYRQDITGQTGSVLTIGNVYNLGAQELQVYRNGVLLFNSSSLGTTADRYQETTTTTITLAQAALSSEVFSFIIR